MYKRTQDSGDWIKRTGSHADRPVLHANVAPRKFAHFEEGRLAALRDEKVRLLQNVERVGMTPRVSARLGAINLEIKRLNREASEASERQLLWQAAREALDPATYEKFNQRVIWLRMRAEGAGDEEIATVISMRKDA